MENIIFFEDQGVVVTSDHFIVFGESIEISQIKSVHTRLEKPSRFFPITLIVIGWALVAMVGAIAFVPIALGIIWLFMQKKRFSVKCKTRTGETYEIENKNRDFIKNISDALAEARKTRR